MPPSVASALAITAHGGLALGTGPGAGYNGVDLNAAEGLQLNPDGTISAKAELYAGGSGVGLAGTRIPILPPSAALLQSVNIDTPHSVSPYPHLKNPLLSEFSCRLIRVFPLLYFISLAQLIIINSDCCCRRRPPSCNAHVHGLALS